MPFARISWLPCVVVLAASVAGGCHRSEPAASSFAARFDRAIAETNAEDRSDLLLRLAWDQYRAKDTPGTRQSLDEAKRAAADVTDPSGRASLFYRIAALQALAGQRSGAENAIREAQSAAQQIEQPESRAIALCNTADVEGYWLKKPDAARQTLEQALKLADKLDDPRGRIAVLAEAGRVYAHIGDQQQADRVIGNALELAGKTADPAGRAGALVQVAQAQIRMKDNKQAVETLGLARQATDEITSLHSKALKLADVAERLDQAGETAAAQQVLDAAQEAARRIKDNALREQATHRVVEVRNAIVRSG